MKVEDQYVDVLQNIEFGIIITYRNYNEYKSTVDIRTCEIIEGNLPGRQTKLVLAWAELHQEELMADWRLVMSGEEPFKIEPLW